MSAGRLTQIGPPRQIYEAPVDLATAAFVGDAVTLTGVLVDSVARCALGNVLVQPSTNGRRSGTGTVLLRPEQIELTELGSGIPADAVLGEVEGVDYYGHDSMIRVRLTEPEPSCVISMRHTGTAAPGRGAKVQLRVRGMASWFPDAD
jgi:iron(III) transport system ATP-binding protein